MKAMKKKMEWRMIRKWNYHCSKEFENWKVHTGNDEKQTKFFKPPGVCHAKWLNLCLCVSDWAGISQQVEKIVKSKEMEFILSPFSNSTCCHIWSIIWFLHFSTVNHGGKIANIYRTWWWRWDGKTVFRAGMRKEKKKHKKNNHKTQSTW